MKKLFLTILIFAAAAGLSAQDGGIINFEGTFTEAVTEAGSQGKHVLLDCYTSWCGPCKRMDADVFPLREVGDFVNPRFVFIKSDMEAGEGPELAKRFGVNAYPTYIVFDPEGNEVRRFVGGRTADEFVEELAHAIDKNMSLEALSARYNAGERGKEFLSDYIRVLSSYGSVTPEVVEELMNVLSDEEKISPKYWYIFQNYTMPGSVVEEYLLKNGEKFKATIHEEIVDQMLWRIAATYYLNMMNPRSAMPTSLKLEEVNGRVLQTGHYDTPRIALYRALTEFRANGDFGSFLRDVGQAQENADVGDMSVLVSLLSEHFKEVFSAEQKEELKSIIKDEYLQELLEEEVVIR